MQALPLLFAGGKGLATVASIAGTAVSGFAAFSQAQYQSRVAANNAAVAEQNAVRARQEAAIHAQDQDLQASMEIGQMLAAQGASGLSLGVGSMGLRRKSAEELAAKDRGYTIYAGETKAAAYGQQAEDFRAESSAASSAGKFGLLGTAIGFGDSLISRATKVNAKTARRIAAA